jgi:membrane protease YdiL (CAAX protease family)
VIVAVAVLFCWNLAANLLLPDAGDFVVAASGIGVLLLIARRSGIDWVRLGLGAGSVRQGIRDGLVAVAIVAAAILLVALVPVSREFLADDRFSGVPAWEMLYEVFARIPLLTALGEEMAFRGVLLALLLTRFSPVRAVFLSSALFGLWHVLPGIEALETTTASELSSGVLGALSVAGQVLVTGLAGGVFAWLRLHSGSLAAPVLAHWGLNGVAYFAGWLIVQNGWA